jgi:hypothetical protein
MQRLGSALLMYIQESSFMIQHTHIAYLLYKGLRIDRIRAEGVTPGRGSISGQFTIFYYYSLGICIVCSWF